MLFVKLFRRVALEFHKRAITALVLAALLIGAWMMGGLVLQVSIMLIALVGSWEYYRMFFGKERKRMLLFASTLPLIILGLVFYTPIIDLLAFALVFLGIAIFTLFRWPSDEKKALREGAILLSGVVYLPVLIYLINYLSPYELLYAFFLPAINDTFAYLSGLKFGKHKIWVQVSPKKSVEGSIGGMLASIVFSMAFCSYHGEGSFLAYGICGAILSIMAQLGDFFESALKRTTQVKDSSSILPGHGGVLDRLDSILFVVPVLLFILSLFPELKF